VLRTRPPRSTPEGARARLACIRHAASVDPEPGSNSPPKTPKRPLTPKRQDSLRESVDSEESRPVRQRSLAPVPGAACDGHALRSGLLAVCECNGPCPQRPPERVHRAQAPSARSVFGTRPDVAFLQSLRLKRPHRPCASLSRCRPARSDSHRHGRCGSRRFTRSIRPPVPRSGVAPHRSLQSLPRPRHPVKGRESVVSALSRSHSIASAPGFTGDLSAW
jgi:hypothetical protein